MSDRKQHGLSYIIMTGQWINKWMGLIYKLIIYWQGLKWHIKMVDIIPATCLWENKNKTQKSIFPTPLIKWR